MHLKSCIVASVHKPVFVIEYYIVLLFISRTNLLKNKLSRALPCFGRQEKPLSPAAYAVVSTLPFASGRRPVVKIMAEPLSQHDEKHVVPTPLSGIKVRKLLLFMFGTFV
jgi:hypothetical protein